MLRCSVPLGFRLSKPNQIIVGNTQSCSLLSDLHSSTYTFFRYYSTYGHVAKLADEIQKGVSSVEGVDVKLWQVITLHNVTKIYAEMINVPQIAE